MFETWKSGRRLKRDNLEIGSNDRLHARGCVFKNRLEFDQLNKLGRSSPQKMIKLRGDTGQRGTHPNKNYGTRSTNRPELDTTNNKK